MHEEALPPHSLALMKRLEAARLPALAGWTLAGGTGLALRLGHRVSDDFDFFRTTPMNLAELHAALSAQGRYELLQEAEHTLTVRLRRTKLSFFRIADPFLFPATPYRFFQVADVRDIALMKLAAISGRGSRKDFVDLYMILRGGLSLQECFAWLPRKYVSARANPYHLLKSLTYFADAEQEPACRMRIPFDWQECKAFFVREAHALVLPSP